MDLPVLVVGSGAAGLATALRCAAYSDVLLLTKEGWCQGASRWAQGGIAAVSDPSDRFDDHINDTLRAGAGLCVPEVVQEVVRAAPHMIEWLRSLGVVFDDHLGQEGGHSARRIVHVADHTGLAITEALLQAVQAHSRITGLTEHMAVDLWMDDGCCRGLWVWHEQRMTLMQGSAVVLATGGASKAYLYTTSPETASGDGMAMAYRAGCRLVDLEFNQFHPTCLYHAHASPLLMTEAIRGEGGLLKIPGSGETFMAQHDERAELAPRDVVARAMDWEMKQRGLDYLWLDISHQPAHMIRERFPMLYQRCMALGLDMTQQPIPVVPAAHYTCGGVWVDDHARTDVPGLWAVGEVACTGLHGGNRLASNSLLECLVGAWQASSCMEQQRYQGAAREPERAPTGVTQRSQALHQDDPVWRNTISHDWDACRRVMWDYVGIVRHQERLEQACKHLTLLYEELQPVFMKGFHPDALECLNLLQLSLAMVACAQVRRESRGLHALHAHPEVDQHLEGYHSWIKQGQRAILAPWSDARA